MFFGLEQPGGILDRSYVIFFLASFVHSRTGKDYPLAFYDRLLRPTMFFIFLIVGGGV